MSCLKSLTALTLFISACHAAVVQPPGRSPHQNLLIPLNQHISPIVGCESWVTVRPGDTCARVSQLCLTTVRHLIQTVQIGPINPSEAIFNRASCGANNLTPFPQNSIGRFICCRKIPGPERGAQSFAGPPVRMAQIAQIDNLVMDAANGLFGLFTLRPETPCFEDNVQLNAGTVLINLTNFQSARVCAKRCQITLGCQAWNYEKLLRECQLFSDAGQSKIANLAFISGPKFCSLALN